MPRKTSWIAASIALAACSCASAPRTVAIDAARPIVPVQHTAPAKGDSKTNDVSPLRGQSPDGASSEDAGFAVIGRKPSRVEPAGHRSGRIPGVYFTPAEMRGPIDCPVGPECEPGAPCAPPAGRVTFGPPVGGPPAGFAAIAPFNATFAPIPAYSLARSYPDEYVCDGGDAGLPVHYDQYNRLGLETEDTVGEYVDSDGTFRVKPSTRVCIYAPRFGAMRTVSGPNADTAVHRLASAHETQFGAGLRNRDVVNLHAQRQGTDRLRVQSRLSGLEVERKGVGAMQATAVVIHSKLINTFQDLAFVQTGQLLTGEEARLANGIQSAIAWNRVENPVISARTIALQEVRASFRPMEIVGREDRRTKGDLRIVKLADKKTAVPGDLVTFTIRYDNIGELPVSQVRIADNLSPRLEFLEDTATSDRAGEVTTEDNGEGSVLVTIELDEPLPGKTGGVITFQTRVR